MSDNTRSQNDDEQAYTPHELAAGVHEAGTPTDAVGDRVGGEGAGVAGLGATTKSQTGGALSTHMRTREGEGDMPGTGPGVAGVTLVGGQDSNPFGDPAEVDDRAGLDVSTHKVTDRADTADPGLEGPALTEAERDRLAP